MNSKERAEKRAEANQLEPLLHIGKDGVTDAVRAQANDTFNTRELFKVKVHLDSCPTPPRDIARELSKATNSEIVQVVGGTIVLFKINPELRRKAAEKKKLAAQKKREEARERRLAQRAKLARKAYYTSAAEKPYSASLSKGRPANGKGRPVSVKSRAASGKGRSAGRRTKG